MASLKGRALRATNHLLSTLGLKLELLSSDVEMMPLDGPSQFTMAKKMAETLSVWIKQQAVFPVSGPPLTGEDVLSFYKDWKSSPFVFAGGGSRFNNLCTLFSIARAYQPLTIVDSGTYRGASVWALKKGCPEAEIHSFDLDLSVVASREDGVKYHEADWFSLKHELDKNKSLFYFDDHVDQIRRLIEVQQFGGKVAIFDDDFNAFSFARMAPSVNVLPKIEFALDDNLKNSQELVWRHRGKELRFKIDQEYLAKGRAAIHKTDRVVDTSIVTGIQQTPYRIVEVANLL